MALVLPEDRFYSPSPALRALYTLDFLLQSPDYWQSNNNFSNRYSRYYKSKKKEYSIILEIIFFFRLKTMQNIRYHHLILVNISWNRSIRIIIISQCVIQRCVIIGIYIILVKLIFFIISDLQICIFTSSSDA